MTEPLVPIPVPDLTVIVQPVAAVLAAYGAAKVGPPLIRSARQRAYDEASSAEAVRLVISSPAGLAPDPDLAVELVRAFHPRQRRGIDGWRVGWPSVSSGSSMSMASCAGKSSPIGRSRRMSRTRFGRR